MTRATAGPISGEVFKWAIHESGLTERHVAERLDVSPSVLREWEVGSAFPTETRRSWVSLTGITIQFLD